MSYPLLCAWPAVPVASFLVSQSTGTYRRGRAGVLRVPDSRDPDHRRDCRSVGRLTVENTLRDVQVTDLQVVAHVHLPP